MAYGWRERLLGLRSWLARQNAPQMDENALVAPAPLAINLGIDFGTSFTKVGFRDVGTEEMGIVTFGGASAEEAMIPSLVAIDKNGTLTLAGAESVQNSRLLVRYLKMRLADYALSDRDPTMPEKIPEVCNVDLNTLHSICALSSWFLASVIRLSQQWVLENEAPRAKGRAVEWSANIGVPVEYYDSPAIGVFRKVLAVAWEWVKTNNIPVDIHALLDSYKSTSNEVQVETSDCHAVAEIAAAVQSFISSREAVPGIYVYFDIGGGSLDGVAFDFVNWNGQRRINFYSGRVAPLGIAALSTKCDSGNSKSLEEALVMNAPTQLHATTLRPRRKEVQLLVANVVMTAKKKDTRDWQRDKIQDTSRFQRRIGHINAENMVPLLVFLGGGGATSTWYQNAILSTHKDFGHINAGVPPYALTHVRTPPDLNMGGLNRADFGRFAVAYGLSVPAGEADEIGLPSEFEEVKRVLAPRTANVVDYLDSKDVYD